MNPALSRYLDLLRVVAALVVFLGHAGHGHLMGGVLWRFTYWGHEAVMVFFVLSGYVISHVAHSREHNLKAYSVARLSRLYSVILPIMLFTWACDTIGYRLSPHAYTTTGLLHQDHPAWLTYGLSLLMLNQSWSWATHFGSDAAYWSIPFEFWYYALFATVFFLRGWQRLAATLIVALIAGPRILAMLPIWLLGVLAQQANQRARPMAWVPACSLAALSAVLMLGMLLWDVTHGGRWSLGPLEINNWGWDMLLALLVASHIRAMHGVLSQVRWPGPGWADRALTRAAGATLALYLLHLPLLSLLNAMALHFGGGPGWVAAYLVAPLLLSLTLGYRLEATKHHWRRWLSRWLNAGSLHSANQVAQSTHSAKRSGGPSA